MKKRKKRKSRDYYFSITQRAVPIAEVWGIEAKKEASRGNLRRLSRITNHLQRIQKIQLHALAEMKR